MCTGMNIFMHGCMQTLASVCEYYMDTCLYIRTWMYMFSHIFWEANHSLDQTLSPSEEMLTGQPLICFIIYLPLWVCAVLRRPEQGARCHGTRVTGSCKRSQPLKSFSTPNWGIPDPSSMVIYFSLACPSRLHVSTLFCFHHLIHWSNRCLLSDGCFKSGAVDLTDYSEYNLCFQRRGRLVQKSAIK